MVVWSDLVSAISANPHKGYNVQTLALREASADVERFGISAIVPCATPQPIKVAEVPMVVLAPPPPRVEAVSEVPKVVPPVKRTETKSAEMPKPTVEPHTLKQVIDPIVLGLEHVDPLYGPSPARSRRAIEIEQAQKLEAALDGLYKQCGGRSRGWVKGTLDAMIKPRCASGGDLYEIDRAKKTYTWALHADDKTMSAFLDFVCLARKIRCAVWHPETKTIYVYPAADMPADPGDAPYTPPLYHVDSTGHVRHGMPNSKDLLSHADKEGWKLLPPHSVLHTLSGLKLDELESVGKKLGMAEVSGNKSARVLAIAEYKLRSRLV